MSEHESRRNTSSFSRSTELTRRDFLRVAASSGAAVSIPTLLTACGSSDNDDATGVLGGGGGGTVAESSFQHGVASGDPLQDRVILWTRLTFPSGNSAEVSWVIASDPELKNITNEGTASADAARDFTVKVDADGLAPNTTYFYQFTAFGQSSPIGRTKTLPTGDIDRARFAVVSCASLPHGFFNAYRRIADRPDLDFVLHLGDYIYEYPGVDGEADGDYGDNAAISAGRQYSEGHRKEPTSLADYRQRHFDYKLDPDLMALHQQYAFITIWDDHEFTDNAWRDGAHNHDPETEGDWATRNAVARQAYFEWLPIRPVTPGDTSRIDRNFQIGNLAELMTLDTRWIGRDEQPEGTEIPGVTAVFSDMGDIDPNGELLGPEQEARFISNLQSSTAQWKLVGQQVVFAQWRLAGLPGLSSLPNQEGQGGVFINSDQWDAYPRARERIWDVIRGGQPAPNVAINNIVVLTGDVHASFSHDITEDPTNILAYNPQSGDGSMAVEFVCPSVTSPAGFPDTPATIPAFLTQNPHIKFGDIQRRGYMLVDITTERCQSEWYFVDDHVAPNDGESLGTVFGTQDGQNHVVDTVASMPRENAPPFAPTG